MKFVVPIVVLLILSGCAANKPLQYQVAGFEKSSAVVIEDARPALESEQTVFSVLLHSDAYAIYRNKDTLIDPTPIRLLQHRVYEKYGSTAKKVKINHFVSYTNRQATLRRAAIGGAFGPVGAVAASASVDQNAKEGIRILDCKVLDIDPEKEYTRAAYTPGENPGKSDLFIIYIDGEIDGKRVCIKKISSTVEKDSTHPYVAAVNSTIRVFLSSF
ncbi:MAG: hypothetical protein K4571_02635 [Deltaproteobacteria bacterium]